MYLWQMASVAVHAARRSLPSSRAGAVSCKKQEASSEANLKYRYVQTCRASLASALVSMSLSLFFVHFISLLLCPSFILSPSSCSTLDRFLPLHASSLLDNHNPCSSFITILAPSSAIVGGKTETSTQPVETKNQPEPAVISPFEAAVAL
jgi:hypothetical protein